MFGRVASKSRQMHHAWLAPLPSDQHEISSDRDDLRCLNHDFASGHEGLRRTPFQVAENGLPRTISSAGHRTTVSWLRIVPIGRLLNHCTMELPEGSIAVPYRTAGCGPACPSDVEGGETTPMPIRPPSVRQDQLELDVGSICRGSTPDHSHRRQTQGTTLHVHDAELPQPSQCIANEHMLNKFAPNCTLSSR